MCFVPRNTCELSSMKNTSNSSLPLEFAACNDLPSFKNIPDTNNHPALWYSRTLGTNPKMGFALRTPLMIAALYGSIDVLQYILTSSTFKKLAIDVNEASETDGATALHLAAAGGAANCFESVKILLDASADIDALDCSGRRAGDIIATCNAKYLDVILKSSTIILPSYSSSPTHSNSSDEKKKEYPLDLTLPDIKNGIYGTDEFRMYTFKVKPCSRAYSHDWTECPFVHPGENARRRDPRKFVYSCVPCPEFRKGACVKGDTCEYAHGIFESWLHPAQYRTRLCKDEVGCGRKICFFAHKVEELRSVNPAAVSVNGLGSVSSPKSVAGFEAYMFSTSPLSSPATTCAVSNGMGSWMNSQIPQLQLPNSRLKSSLSFRDIDVESYRQNLLDQIQTVASPLSYGQQSMYNLPSSPNMNASASAMAKAIMNSRAASFAQRSQSFVDRGGVSHFSPTKATNWGSPNGKLDWGMQGEEVNKFKKSATFAMRNDNPIAYEDEPDLSWVHSLVKDGPGNDRGEFAY